MLILKIGMALLFFGTPLISWADLQPDSVQDFTSAIKHYAFKGYGFFRVRIDEVSEPVNKPNLINIELRCPGAEHFQTVLSDFGVCSFDKFVLKDGSKEAVVLFKAYNPDSGKCERPSEKKITVRCNK